MTSNSNIECVGESSIYASSLVLSVIHFMWWILKFTCARFHHVLDFSEGWKLRLRAMARMEVFQDFSHNSKPSGVARHLSQLCSLLLSIYLYYCFGNWFIWEHCCNYMQEEVVLGFWRMSHWDFDWQYNYLQGFGSSSPACNEGPLKHNQVCGYLEALAYSRIWLWLFKWARPFQVFFQCIGRLGSTLPGIWIILLTDWICSSLRQYRSLRGCDHYWGEARTWVLYYVILK